MPWLARASQSMASTPIPLSTRSRARPGQQAFRTESVSSFTSSCVSSTFQRQSVGKGGKKTPKDFHHQSEKRVITTAIHWTSFHVLVLSYLSYGVWAFLAFTVEASMDDKGLRKRDMCVCLTFFTWIPTLGYDSRSLVWGCEKTIDRLKRRGRRERYLVTAKERLERRLGDSFPHIRASGMRKEWKSRTLSVLDSGHITKTSHSALYGAAKRKSEILW